MFKREYHERGNHCNIIDVSLPYIGMPTQGFIRLDVLVWCAKDYQTNFT